MGNCAFFVISILNINNHKMYPQASKSLESNELSAPLDVSKECEALCPEGVEDFGFL